MNKLILIITLSITNLAALQVGTWQNVRFSGYDAQNRFFLRSEIAAGTTTSNKVLYRSGTAVAEADLELINSDTSTFQKQVPGTAARSYLGSRPVSATGVTNLFPVYYDGSALPGLAELTKFGDDETNTGLTNYYDIVADYIAFSDTKLYMAIRNRGGGFPTSASFGTVYPSYMSVIANPASDPNEPGTIVWAMAYMNVSLGGISPGLFKITGTGTSGLNRIGNIQTQIISGSNLLIMSCDIADLLADPDFAAWYNPTNPIIGTQTITNKTTVIPFATTKQDETSGAIVNLKKLFYDPDNNASLSAAELVIESDDLYFSTQYSHSLGYFPLDINLQLQQIETYPLYPQSQDFSQSVHYRTANLLGTLPEFDPALGRTGFSMGGDTYSLSSWVSYSYVAGINSPQGVNAVVENGSLLLSWSPVTQSLAGTPINITRYRIEFSSEPTFTSPVIIGYSNISSFTLPASELPDKAFYRITAEKTLP